MAGLTDIDQLYSQYKAKPSPDGLARVVKALEPTVRYALSSVNALDDPLIRSQALLHTADAVDKYNPKNVEAAKLPTFVAANLRQLTRTARQSRSPIKIPERAQLDAYKLSQARKRYEDEHGREPDALELADYTGMPVKRINKVGNYQMVMPSESAVGDLQTEEPDFENEAVHYVYHESDHTDRKILEHKTGYGGAQVMAPKEIATKLNLTPVQLSRRSARLSSKIQQIRSSLERI